jgi:hypothetical protein
VIIERISEYLENILGVEKRLKRTQALTYLFIYASGASDS